MKIIVFGGSGFLGSHVADALTIKGHEVIIYDLVKSPYLKDGQFFVVGDILDEKLVADTVKGCEIVFSFAGIADLEEAKKDPMITVRNNILGTTNILEACRKNQVKRFIFASTLYVYSKAGSFYRSSKQACELLIDNYNEIYGLDYTIIRYGSLYGPRAEELNWLYKTVKDALTLGKIVRHGDGEELREYIHALDAARLSVEAIGADYRNQHVIITGNQQIKIKDLMIMIKEMLNNETEIEFKSVDLSDHYEITPYNFSPKLAKRLQSNHYVDLGQGILDIMGEIYKKSFPHNMHNELYVKD